VSAELRYPIGQFSKPDTVSAAERERMVDRIRVLPARLRASVNGLSSQQLDTPYRDGGWTVREVVHHIGDSHLNALVRFKLGLTESTPTVRPYDENLWLQTGDAINANIDEALDFVDAMHRRFTAVVSSIDDEGSLRTIIHPDSGEQTLAQLLANYAWHGDHHVAHITALRERNGW
jgi:uncharacterized damage-inducible protein DinB